MDFQTKYCKDIPQLNTLLPKYDLDYNSFQLKIESIDQVSSLESSICNFAKPNTKTAYISFDKSLLESISPHLSKLNFEFYKYEKPIFTFYKWLNEQSKDKVPAHLTTFSSVNVLLLDSEEKNILLVWEYEKWKNVTGSVDLKESFIEAATRELKEEVNCITDSAFIPKLVMVELKVKNDAPENMFYLVFKALNKLEIKPDEDELEKIKWFPLDYFILKETITYSSIENAIDYKDSKFAISVFMCIKRFKESKFLTFDLQSCFK